MTSSRFCATFNLEMAYASMALRATAHPQSPDVAMERDAAQATAGQAIPPSGQQQVVVISGNGAQQ
jgi:hypothetical protein